MNRFFWGILLITIVLLNVSSLNGPYLLDDTHTLEGNAHIQSLSSLGKVWTSGRYYSALPATWGYRPLTTTTNILSWVAGSGNPWPFHAFKWFVFFLICFFTFNIWRELLPDVSDVVLKVSLFLFAVNPVHSQLMGYISATSSLFASLFVVIAIDTYLKFRKTNQKTHLVICLLSVFFATMSKEEGVVVIALLFGVELFLNFREKKKIGLAGLKKLIAPLVVCVFGAVLIYVNYEPTQGMVRGEITSWQYFMTQWRAYLRYMAMFVWSFNLNADNLNFEFSKSFSEVKVILALIVNLLLLAFALIRVKTQPLYLLSLFWFYAAVSPSSSIIPLGEAVNDHRALTAYVGMGLVFTYFLSKIYRKTPQMFWVIGVILAVSYSSLSYQRSKDWSDSVTLWQDTVKKNPTSPRAFNNLATALMARGKDQQALDIIEQCLKITEGYSYCHTNKAILLVRLGREEKVNESFERGVALDVHYVNSRLYWAKYLISRGLLQKAKELLLQADTLTAGNNLQVRVELIATLYKMGLKDQSYELSKEALNRFGDLESLRP